MAPARRPGGKTALMIASDNPSTNAKATPRPALAMISMPTCGAAAPSTPKKIDPQTPRMNIFFMPARSPSAPAPSTAAARVRVHRLARKLAVPGVNCSPSRTWARLAEKMVGSAAAMLNPSPIATMVMVAARPVTSCWLTTAQMLAGRCRL